MAVDLRRRKAVMGRSLKLGRCVCNPLKPCPCPEFREFNVCACAGEKMPAGSGAVPLTKMVKKAGCASKIGQADLMRVLKDLPPVEDPNVLVGMAAGDDAGVYRLGDGRCLVQTVDVFTPCVDDARTFGRIAAANSLSDCYAMGARPLTALSVVCFPMDALDGAQMREMLLGGMEKLREAGCALIGGHSVNDEEVKCGFAITGLLESERAVERGAARAGDALVLTKPLGTGILCFAAQIGRLGAGWRAEVARSMETLNRDASDLMRKHGAHGCTDVTGFGLAGHLVEMARGGGLCAEVALGDLPVFAPVADCLREGIFGGAVEKNMEYAMAWVRGEAPDSAAWNILFDPQTSGGLLIALPPESAGALVSDLRALGHGAACVIGRMAAAGPERLAGTLWVTGCDVNNLVGEKTDGLLPAPSPGDGAAAFTVAPGPASNSESQKINAEENVKMSDNASCCSSNSQPASCCSGNAAPEPASCCSGNAPEPAASCCSGNAAPGMFMDFLREANNPGALDARVKKLLAIALSVAQKCEPCLRIHLESAAKMGLSKAEVDEAAWLGVAFGGAPCMMLYQSVSKELGR